MNFAFDEEQEELRAMADEGAAAVAMEVSSHAMGMGRVSGAKFDVGVFTNLGHDHLRAHGSVEHYLASKAQLFLALPAGGGRFSAWVRRGRVPVYASAEGSATRNVSGSAPGPSLALEPR